ncbi:GGDEF domain-containing protein [Terriglobus sp. TAA 43]|uniref:GGDEF domain-containing protein n=1 Tax=Terriglobus sp. TAA 43 TaxID=278961 RepID=UPI00068EDA5A|nr:GGDEF domain-containing protein [Terriglobus sp. TAA 43]
MKEPQQHDFDTAKRIAQEWTSYVDELPADVLPLLQRILNTNYEDLRQRYMAYLTGDEGIAAVVTRDETRTEFTGIFLRWITDLLSLPDLSVEVFCAKQIEVGYMMERMGLPAYAVSRAMRKLKLWFLRYLALESLSAALLVESMHAVISLVDFSVEIREVSYQSSAATHARTEEAYRLQALGQNLATERERQRASLMEWGNIVLTAFHQGDSSGRLPRLWKSDFGLWVNHKADLIFGGVTEMGQIVAAINRVDSDLIPGLAQSAHAERAVISEWLRRIQEEISCIKFSLSAMFEARLEAENGRDPLTQLLNRRFLPSLLAREIALQKRRSDSGFCVLMLDLDHFKNINDQYGHQSGDIVLRHAAEVIISTARPSDFAFRYGGEEFVLVLVDCTLEHAEEVAQRIRQRIQEMEIMLPTGDQIRVTASCGVGLFSDDLDYELLLARVDEALYLAKHKGRNRVEVAHPPSIFVASKKVSGSLLRT